ncbi:protein-L-isoaspartate O-methyltransferase isoform X8 [Polyergus mexicanus]|uniref:protein-L-isoaspartate O-methyltransferase isoform X8 n=1 Tax=Polyergus mexicanus TaxID=615972 RepID=UPI0038B53CE9
MRLYCSLRDLLGYITKPVDRKKNSPQSMAWHCNGTTNQEMVTKLKAIRDRLFTDAGILATDRAEAAMLIVDRAKYCHESDPYLDRPRRIGYNVTISAPHMHAYALSILSDQLFDGAKALDVGSGSGYLSACMAYMVGSNGHVIGIEHIPELIEISTRNVREDNPDFFKENRIKFIEIYCTIKKENVQKVLHVCIIRIKDTRDPSTWSRYVRCREESNGTLSTDCMALL